MAQKDHENAIYDASPLVGEKGTWEGYETMILHECVTTFFTTMGFSKEYHTFIFDILHRSVSVNEGAPYSKCV